MVGSPRTKLCPLVGSGILYMNHPKDQALCLVLDSQGKFPTFSFRFYSGSTRMTVPNSRKPTDSCSSLVKFFFLLPQTFFVSIWSNFIATSRTDMGPLFQVANRKGNGTPAISGKSRWSELLFHLARSMDLLQAPFYRWKSPSLYQP